MNESNFRGLGSFGARGIYITPDIRALAKKINLWDALLAFLGRAWNTLRRLFDG